MGPFDSSLIMIASKGASHDKTIRITVNEKNRSNPLLIILLKGSSSKIFLNESIGT